MRAPFLHVRVREWEPERKKTHSEKRSLTSLGPMCCYVGKATKIFLCLLTALLLAGLVLGFGLARRTLWGARKAEPTCRWPRCSEQPEQPLYGSPLLPATATSPPSTPLTEPAEAVFPGFVASSTAMPPAAASVPHFGPPNPSFTAVPPAAASVPYFGPPSPSSTTGTVPPAATSVPYFGPPSPSSTTVPPAATSVPYFGPPSPSSTTVPPAATSVPYLGPPSPFSVGPGPSSGP